MLAASIWATQTRDQDDYAKAQENYCARAEANNWAKEENNCAKH
jgi:hypothetical protein